MHSRVASSSSLLSRNQAFQQRLLVSPPRYSSSLVVRSRNNWSYPLALSSTHYRHHYGTSTGSTSKSSASSSTSSPQTKPPKNVSSNNYSLSPNERRSLSSLSTADARLQHSHDCGAVVTVINAATSTTKYNDMKSNVDQKNVEVNQLLQSLQKIVQTRQNLGLYHNALPPKVKTGSAKVTTVSIPSMQMNDDNINLSEITELTPSPTANERSENEQIKNWHNKFRKAIFDRHKRHSVRLFYEMPPLPSINSFVPHNEDLDVEVVDSDDVNMKKVAAELLSDFNRMISFIPTKRLDVAFDVFLKGEEIYYNLEQYLQHQEEQKEERYSVENQTQFNNNEQYMSYQKLKSLREMLLYKIARFIGNAKEPNAPQKKTMKKKHAPSSKRTTEASLHFTDFNYIDMAEQLLHIIQHDIHDDPVLQHRLYPVFLQSLNNQSLSASIDFQGLQKKAWDTALSSLERELGGLPLKMGEEKDKESMSDDDDDHDRDEVAAIQRHHEIGEEERFKWAKNIDAYKELLESSTYRRQETLPFVKALGLVVDYGGKPKPQVALNIIQNEYPFGNFKNNRSILESIIKLQQSKSPTQSDYLIDSKTLEYITCSSSKRGHSSIVTLIWEYMNSVRASLMEHDNSSPLCSLYSKPTEGLYENAVMTFAASTNKDHLVLSILDEMEKEGYKPTRLFLSRLSARLRSSVRRLDHAMYMMRSNFNRSLNNYSDSMEYEHQHFFNPTTSSLNAIMCAYADLGFSAKAMDLYNEFEDLQCVPDENTYIFLMDSVLMNVTTAIPSNFVGGQQGRPDDEDLISWLESQVDAANAIVDVAIQMGFGLNEHLLHSYLKLLCAIGELDKAMYLLEERLDSKQKISLESFECVALSLAKIGKMDVVENIAIMSREAGYENGISKFVLDRIDRLKK